MTRVVIHRAVVRDADLWLVLGVSGGLWDGLRFASHWPMHEETARVSLAGLLRAMGQPWPDEIIADIVTGDLLKPALVGCSAESSDPLVYTTLQMARVHDALRQVFP